MLEVIRGTITIRIGAPVHQSARQNAQWFCVVNTAIVTGHDPLTVPPPDPPMVY